MWRWVVAAAGLFFLGAAAAADLEQDEPVDQVAFQGVPGIDKAAEKLDEEKAKREERLKALEELGKGKTARVIVLAKDGTDDTNDTLQRSVKTRIARPDAKFYGDIDLYQVGRREPDRTIRAIDQRGTVPAASIAIVNSAVAEIEGVTWDALDETEWGLKAQELLKLVDEIWFVDREDLREPLFKLYAQIGRAAENMNNNSPPFFEQIGGQPVNYFYFMAAAFTLQDDGLLGKLSNPDLSDSISYYAQQLKGGGLPMMTMSFGLNGTFDPKEFAGEYTAFINGSEVLITDKDGNFKVSPGRTDVYLKRSDGHSISDKVELDKLEDKIYFVRETARKRMGEDFYNQLMDHPNECSPELDGDILVALNIYAKLHPEAEIYIATPIAGNPNNIGLWRFDRPSGTLQKVLDNTGGFPVRFAVMMNTGILAGGLSVDSPEIPDPPLPGETPVAPTPPSLDPADYITPAAIPFDYQLRGHWGRLMVMLGTTFSASISGGFTEYYQTGGGRAVNDDGSDKLKELTFNRLIYFGAGAVLKKEAANGFGPRGYVRVGFWNAPHTVEITGHGGMTIEGPGGGTGRIRFLIDTDVGLGVLIPFGDSLYATPMLAINITGGAGLTF